MLSSKTIEIVKSTGPVLSEHGLAITTIFYKKLFAGYPELQDTFNMVNQEKGDQAKALADAVFKYATYIDKLEMLSEGVNRIAHKHASLQVLPEHYPIVGKVLLESIGEHLNLEHDHEIIQAWAQAYEALASILIGAEENIYKNNEEKIGGWRGFREFEIFNIKDESCDVKSFYLRPKDGQGVATYEAGQYVGIKLPERINGYEEIRQYSLSDLSGNDYYRISVKADATYENIKGVFSNELHQKSVGDTVYLQPPTGEFVLSDSGNARKVFIAAGVGITPLLSMLYESIAKGENINELTFIVCFKSSPYHVMKHHLKELAARHGFNYKVVYEQSHPGETVDYIGYINKDVLKRFGVVANSEVYFCGPKPFMRHAYNELKKLGVRDDAIFYETYGPSISLVD